VYGVLQKIEASLKGREKGRNKNFRDSVIRIEREAV
jgi:hypothetical protein